MYLKLLCSLISVIVKTALGPRQALRNLSHMFAFPSLLEKVSQYWSAFSAEYCRTNPAGGKEQEFLSSLASLTVARIRSIVSCAVGCCLQKQGSPCSDHFEIAEKIRLDIFFAGCTMYLSLQYLSFRGCGLM